MLNYIKKYAGLRLCHLYGTSYTKFGGINTNCNTWIANFLKYFHNEIGKNYVLK
jgi:hypothetical protein